MPDPSPDDLLALLLAAKEGDDRAVTAFVEATKPAVWRMCLLLGSRGSEEDLLQETYMRALVGLERFEGSGTALGWILAIARNTCVDDVRRRQRRALLLKRDAPTTEAEYEIASWYDATDLLGVVDDDQRDAFVLTQILGMRYGDAAELLRCPIGTVRSRVARARARLIEQVRKDESA